MSCDELVETNYFHKNAEESRYVFWERSATSSIVHAPCGAHPSSCSPLYGIDVEHFKAYAASAKEDNGWANYVEDYVTNGEAHYLDKVGGESFIKALPLPVY